MADAVDGAGRAAQKAKDAHTKAKREIQHNKYFEYAARAGYVAKGALYAIIGYLAFSVAFLDEGALTDSKGAIRYIAGESYGTPLLIALGLGLLGHALWRFAQAILDPDNEGWGKKEAIKRAGKLASGVIHTSLAILTFKIVAGEGSGGGEPLSAQVMSMPAGRWLLGLGALIVLAFAASRFSVAYKKSFMKRLETVKMSANVRRAVERIGQVGTIARGVVFGIAGGLALATAFGAAGGGEQGVGRALSTLAAQPYGFALLGALAVGLIAYAVHCFVMARYRHIPSGDSVTS